jgi:phosphoglycolate phosphatase
MSRIQLVIFDFDGTLVDTAPDLIRAANLFLKAEGLEELSPERIRGEIGLGLRRFILDLYPADQRNEKTLARIEKEFIGIYEKEFLKSPRLFEGARQFLTEWDGRVAIVSNKRARFIHPILKKLELDSLNWARIVGGDTYPNMKPHPEPFLGAMAAAGAEPEETLIVGDGTPDVQGAQAIGSRCVAVDFGYEPVENLMELGAWRSISRYDELHRLIQSIN